MNCFRPLIREAGIAYHRWALWDMQRNNPTHPEMGRVITRLRDLRAERHAPNTVTKRIVQWL